MALLQWLGGGARASKSHAKQVLGAMPGCMDISVPYTNSEPFSS